MELVDQSNPSNCADARLLTQQEFAHLLELANYGVRSEVLDAQDREQVAVHEEQCYIGLACPGRPAFSSHLETPTVQGVRAMRLLG
jgi:hypothetical protein